MKFTIGLSDLEMLLKTLAPRPRPKDMFTLSACAARVFIESKGDVGGVEALVFEEGAVTLPAKKFRELLETYKGRRSLKLKVTPTDCALAPSKCESFITTLILSHPVSFKRSGQQSRRAQVVRARGLNESTYCDVSRVTSEPTSEI